LIIKFDQYAHYKKKNYIYKKIIFVNKKKSYIKITVRYTYPNSLDSNQSKAKGASTYNCVHII